MMPFDLEAAKRSAAVCLQNGSNVRIICFDSNYNYGGIRQPIVAEEYDYEENRYKLWTFCEDGSFFSKVGSNSDLVMRDDDYLERLARGEYATEAGSNSEIPNNCPQPIDWEAWRMKYAGQAMQANIISMPESECICNYNKFAEGCVKIADAMIEELKRSKK